MSDAQVPSKERDTTMYLGKDRDELRTLLGERDDEIERLQERIDGLLGQLAEKVVSNYDTPQFFRNEDGDIDFGPVATPEPPVSQSAELRAVGEWVDAMSPSPAAQALEALEMVTHHFWEPTPPDGKVWQEHQVAKFVNDAIDLLRAAQPPAPEWQPIEAAPKDEEAMFWIRPLTKDEAWCNTSGEPIVIDSPPELFVGKRGRWSSLWTATHWMPLPSGPTKGEG